MTDETLKMDSVTLRAMAENAASQRKPGGDPGFMVTTLDPVKGWLSYFTTMAESPREHDVVTPVSTSTVAERPQVQSVLIQAEGMTQAQELAQEYDAVFWSEAAVEKFLMPYYASKGQWLAAYLLEGISEAFYGHVPQPAAPRARAGRSPGGTDESLPFALAHLPRSDYVGLTEPHVLMADLYVLLVRAGNLESRPLGVYLEEQRARRAHGTGDPDGQSPAARSGGPARP